ncbi:hypothetical protein PQR71_35270 [Paraburkholderia fungorum]|uniref:hypothetical protein n=1 Tax=Paraburkholderia fungorum TaxID=134537 RepID=UPI0038BAC899
MSITKRPNSADPKEIETFIAGAPDAKGQGSVSAPPTPLPPTAKRTSSRKTPISLTVAPALLARVDQAAERLGMSRAAAIALALSRFVDAEGVK